jgi:hypothetical protein
LLQAATDAQTTHALSVELLANWTARRDIWVAFGTLANRTVAHARWAIEEMNARGDAIAQQGLQAQAWTDAAPGLAAQVQAALAVDGPLRSVESAAVIASQASLALTGLDARAFRDDMVDADSLAMVTFNTAAAAEVSSLRAEINALPLPGAPMQPRASAALAQLEQLVNVEATIQAKIDAVDVQTFPAQYDAVAEERTDAINRANALCDTITANTVSAFATFTAVDARNRRIATALSTAASTHTSAEAAIVLAAATHSTAATCEATAAATATTLSVQQRLTQLENTHMSQVNSLAVLDAAINAAETRLANLRNAFFSMPLCVDP